MRSFRSVLFAAVLAAMLLSSAATAQISVQPVPISTTISGIIGAVDLTKGAITLNPPLITSDARSITFFVTPKTTILKNGIAVPLSALAVGDECKATVTKAPDGTLVALTVSAASSKQPVKVSGKIDYIDPLKPVFRLRLTMVSPMAVNGLMTFCADSATLITRNGKLCSFKDLAVGDLATVAFIPPPPTMTPVVMPIRAISIEARTPQPPVTHAIGKLAEKNNGMICVTIMLSSTSTGTTSKSLWFQVTDSTKITKMGPATYDALLVGDMVDVTYVQNNLTVIPPALSINVMPNTARGRVAAVDAVNYLIGIQSSPMGPVKIFKVSDRAKIIKNGKPVPLEAIREGDTAYIQYYQFADACVAVVISAESPVVAAPVVE